MDLENFNIYLQFFSDLSDLFAPFLHSERLVVGAVILAILLWLIHNRGLLFLVVDRLFLRMNILMAFVFSFLTIILLLGCIEVTDDFLEHCHKVYYQYSNSAKQHNDKQRGKKAKPLNGAKEQRSAAATSAPEDTASTADSEDKNHTPEQGGDSTSATKNTAPTEASKDENHASEQGGDSTSATKNTAPTEASNDGNRASEQGGDATSAPQHTAPTEASEDENHTSEQGGSATTEPQPEKSAGVEDGGQEPGKWNLNLVRHFLYIITPGSTLSQERISNPKFIIQVIVVYLGYLVLAGLVVSFLLYLLRNKLQDLERGIKRDYGYLTDHVVIIGSRDYLWKLIEHIENNQEEKPIPEWVPKSLRASWRDWRDKMQRFWDRILDNETLSLFSQRKSILILTSRPAKDVRDELDMHLPRNLVRRTILTHGSCTDERVLRQLNIPKCRALYVIGEVLDESMDSMNLECIRTISRQVLPQPRHLTSSDKDVAEERKIPCHVYFERTATYALLQRGAFEPFRNLIFIPYCFHKNWIEKILCVSDPYLPSQPSDDDDGVRYLPLDREPITEDSSRYVHLIVIGGSRMGLALATEAAHLLHFPNFVSRKIKSRITLIGSQIDEKMLSLQNEVKPFFDYVEWEYMDLSGLAAPGGSSQSVGHIVFRPEKDYIDQKWTFIKGDAHSARLQTLMKEYASDPNALVTVAVCIANDRDASRIALNLPREFYKPGQEIPILVRQEAGAGLMHALHNTKTHNYDKVLPFGMRLDEFDLVQKNSDRRAMISWIVYRNTQRMHQEMRPCDDFTTFRERDKVESDVSDFFDVGTNQKMKWNDLSMRFKFANRYRAYLLWSYLRSVGKVDFKARNQAELDEDLRYLRDILLSHGELMGEVEHNRWNVEQLLLGKLPRPDDTTGSADDIRDIDPYRNLKPINRWCRVNIMLFLYLQVKYYFEAKLRRKQREEAAKQD